MEKPAFKRKLILSNKDRLFDLGLLSITSSLISQFPSNDIMETVISNILSKHISGDFGSVSKESEMANLDSLKTNYIRIISLYDDLVEGGILVITENGYTTLMLSSDY